MQRTFQHQIATKWLELDQDNLHMKSSALNVDSSSPSPDPLCSRRPAQASVKSGYPLKSGYFIAIISCSVKTVADRYKHAAYHSKHWWHAFYWCQRRWPWMTFNPQNRGFSDFLRFSAVTHILKVNCAEMAGDGPGQPVYDIFSIKRTF